MREDMVIERTLYLSDCIEGLRCQDERKDLVSKSFRSDLGSCDVAGNEVHFAFIIEPSLGTLKPRVVVWCKNGDVVPQRIINLRYRVEVWADETDYWREPLPDAPYGSLELEEAYHHVMERNQLHKDVHGDGVLLHEIDLSPLSWAESTHALFACRTLTVSVHIAPSSEAGEGHLVDNPITLHNFEDCVLKMKHSNDRNVWDHVTSEQTRKARSLYNMGQKLSSVPDRAEDGHRILYYALQALLVVNSRGLYPYDRHYIRISQIYTAIVSNSQQLALQYHRDNEKDLVYETMSHLAPHACIMWIYLRPYDFEPYRRLSTILMAGGYNQGHALHMVNLTCKVIETNFSGTSMSRASFEALQWCERLKICLRKNIDDEHEQKRIAYEAALEAPMSPSTTSEDGGTTSIEALTDDDTEENLFVEGISEIPKKKPLRKRKRVRKRDRFNDPSDGDQAVLSSNLIPLLSESSCTHIDTMDESLEIPRSDISASMEPSNASTNKILSKPPPAKRQRMRSFLLTSGTTVRYPCWAAMDSDSD